MNHFLHIPHYQVRGSLDCRSSGVEQLGQAGLSNVGCASARESMSMVNLWRQAPLYINAVTKQSRSRKRRRSKISGQEDVATVRER
jgi:hypothetical protein